MNFLKFIIILLILSSSNGLALGFSTHNTTITRTFDNFVVAVGKPITVTVTFTNSEPYDISAFYYTEQLPAGLEVNTINVKIDESDINNFMVETGSVNDVYPDSFPSRWILETPATFDEQNPVYSGSIVEIIYIIRSSQEGLFHLHEFHWVGYFQDGSGAAFGHSDDIAKRTVSFLLIEQDSDNDIDGYDLGLFASEFEGNQTALAVFATHFGQTDF